MSGITSFNGKLQTPSTLPMFTSSYNIRLQYDPKEKTITVYNSDASCVVEEALNNLSEGRYVTGDGTKWEGSGYIKFASGKSGMHGRSAFDLQAIVDYLLRTNHLQPSNPEASGNYALSLINTEAKPIIWSFSNEFAFATAFNKAITYATIVDRKGGIEALDSSAKDLIAKAATSEAKPCGGCCVIQ